MTLRTRSGPPGDGASSGASSGTPNGTPGKIIIIAGPHGAGKTTFARAFLPAEAGCTHFINADLIATGLSPFAPGTAISRAGRLMLEEIHTCVRRGESFAFESTLSGLGYTHLIWQWQKAGYRVHLYFLSLFSADLAVARVEERARQGGHAIAEEIVRRQFAAGLHNFTRYYRTSADAWVLYDTSWEEPVFLELGENPTQSVIRRWPAAAWKHRLATEHAYAPLWRSEAYTDLALASDKDIAASHIALQRAARAARQTAIQTDTALLVKRKSGKIVRLTANRLKKQYDIF